MTITFTIEKGQKPTEEQLQKVMEAKKQPIVFDEDSTELSPAMYKAFMSSVIQRNLEKIIKQNVGAKQAAKRDDISKSMEGFGVLQSFAGTLQADFDYKKELEEMREEKYDNGKY